MKVLVLGGYGVFGGLLCRLLMEDGVDVVVAGRNAEKARAFTSQFGGSPLCVDLDADLSPIASAALNVVVDAAGPFQNYGQDPYRVARFCIAHRINYLDLSDDAEFTAGISVLNESAIQSGCFVLSGVSTLPAISAAAVKKLRADFEKCLVIETSLAPGNRAPRGRSVLTSILSQTGEPFQVWRGGAWDPYRGWSDVKTVSLGKGINRRVSLIGAPDLKLFPDAFGARSVIFRAGLELGLMHHGLSVLSYLRERGFLPKLTRFQKPIFWAGGLLRFFGSDVGGMAVDVTGVLAGEPVRRRWQVVASRGDGPFIPAIPARAIIRKFASVKPGARPGLFDLDLSEIESAMAGLSVDFTSTSCSAPTLFQIVLHETWAQLPVSVRCTHMVHDIESFSGQAKVSRGKELDARIAAWFFGFPKEGDAIPLTVTKTRTAKGETWVRNFGGHTFRSYLSASSRPYHFRERFSAFTFEQELPVRDGSLHFNVRRGWFLGLPLPAFLLPKSEAREYDIDGVFRFDVGLFAPLTGSLIVRYQGSVSPVAHPVEASGAEA